MGGTLPQQFAVGDRGMNHELGKGMNHQVVGSLTNPFSKISAVVKLDDFPKDRGKNVYIYIYGIFETTTLSNMLCLY